ncbi:MAG: dual specificity protein phosphatase [Candidatus Bathyarchaeia archaeon]
MDWILSNVAIGNWRDAVDIAALISEGVSAILNVRGDEDISTIKEVNEREKRYCVENRIAYCYLPIRDYTPASEEHLINGVAFIEKHTRLGGRVLVHCGAGLGRSPSIVAAYLVYRGYSSEEAVGLIKMRRRGAFEGNDVVHIPNIKRFQRRLTDVKLQIERLIEYEVP